MAGLPSDEPVPGVLPRQVMNDGAPVLEVAFVLVSVQLSEAPLSQVVEVVVADVQPALVLAGHAVLEPVKFVPGVKVHLADGGRVVAALRQEVGPCRNAGFGVIGAHAMEIVGDAIAQGIHACEECWPMFPFPTTRNSRSGPSQVPPVWSKPVRKCYMSNAPLAHTPVSDPPISANRLKYGD